MEEHIFPNVIDDAWVVPSVSCQVDHWPNLLQSYFRFFYKQQVYSNPFLPRMTGSIIGLILVRWWGVSPLVQEYQTTVDAQITAIEEAMGSEGQVDLKLAS